MLTRKCALCGEMIEVSLPYSKEYVYYKPKAKWYHIDCFTVISTPRTHVGDWINKTASFVLSEVSKDDIYNWFINHYDVSVVPRRVFQKLDEIYKGTFKGLAQPIPPHELYDIIVRKDDYLFSIFNKRNIVDVHRIDYALAVAMSSYKSYKAWLSQVQAEQAAAKEKRKDDADFSRVFSIVSQTHDTSKDQEEFFDLEEAVE